MKLVATILSFLAALVVPMLAFAADQQTLWQSALSDFIQAVVAVATPVLVTLAATLLHRWKISIERKTIDDIAHQAVGWAEQKALKALKEGAPKTPGAEKLDMALTFAAQMAEKAGVGKSKLVGTLEDLIESKLGHANTNAPQK